MLNWCLQETDLFQRNLDSWGAIAQYRQAIQHLKEIKKNLTKGMPELTGLSLFNEMAALVTERKEEVIWLVIGKRHTRACITMKRYMP